MSSANMKNLDATTEEISRMIFATIPERKEELIAMYEKYNPFYREQPDMPGFMMEGGPFGAIFFTHRTLMQIWMLGFTSWKAMMSYSGLLFLFRFSQLPFDIEKVNRIPGQNKYDKEFDEAISKVRELAQIEKMDDFVWPDFVPFPPDGKPKDTEEAAVFDLIIMASAYILLHEMKHVQFVQDGDDPQNDHKEEILCDEFARSMMLDNIEEYSKSSGYDLNALINKRTMSIALASFLMLVVTRKEDWKGTRSHPPMSVRVRALIDSVSLANNDFAWNYLASLLLSQLRLEKKLPKEIAFGNPKSFCLRLLDYTS